MTVPLARGVVVLVKDGSGRRCGGEVQPDRSGFNSGQLRCLDPVGHELAESSVHLLDARLPVQRRRHREFAGQQWWPVTIPCTRRRFCRRRSPRYLRGAVLSEQVPTGRQPFLGRLNEGQDHCHNHVFVEAGFEVEWVKGQHRSLA